jgi:biopolymer transport protein ExbB
MIHAYFSQRLENIVTDMESCFSLMETNHAAFAEKVRREEEGAQHALA